ncbi:iron complex transport system substrate-binding protein [Pseudoduganella lurida]|uniref:Iron complex transport system substrate-binding protein n=1 Tax=Pseudoduganella lurida TaxID=1036180 RepID=A0A562QU89_9BURK|nr:cobalamin-binding protein [Pseudoduganella lurida]TWI60352.1 iron complex transport system substrate-binding protein [Pseudoduganella lurida]
MKTILLVPLLCTSLASHAAVTVRDDDGKTVTLAQPAQRIISMAPHVTELLFAAGAGSKIVGAVDYSDYPEAAKAITRVGSNREVDLERVLALKPDLIVVWRHGSSERQIELLRKLGVPLYHSEPTSLDAIPVAVTSMGKLAGTEPAAEAAAADLRKRLAMLRTKYQGRPTVRVFYQVWDKPLYTLNGAHIVSDALRLCGGENIFASQKVTAPVVSVEAVLQQDPEAVFSTAEKEQGGAAMWKQYPQMKATKGDNLFTIDGHLVNRAGPRMIAGTESLCEKLDLARQHRKN